MNDIIQKRAVSLIVAEYRGDVTLRDFAKELTAALLPYGSSISYQTINNWEKRNYFPDTLTLLRLAYARDWRGEMAVDLLAAIDPERYQPATEIGRNALAEAERWFNE